MFKSIEIPRTTDTLPRSLRALEDGVFYTHDEIARQGHLDLGEDIDLTGVDAIFVDGVAYYRFAMYQYLVGTPLPAEQPSLADIAADLDTWSASLEALPSGHTAEGRDPEAYLTFVKAADPVGRAIAYATLSELTEHRDTVVDLLYGMPSAIRTGTLATQDVDRQRFFIHALLAMKDRYAAPAAD